MAGLEPEDSACAMDGIAVIGMAGRFPGARDLRTFWANLRGGVESIVFFTDDELRAAGESEERLRDPNYVRACPRLEGIDQFDAAFFGLSPRDASVFDPQHRFFLECAWEAFETAGYVGSSVPGPVAVFAACGMNEYMIKNLVTNPEVMESVGEWLVRHTGNDTNFLATRVSYELNLRGPSMNVQTACSSSLVAVHLACQSLLAGECDMALAGGSTIYPEQNKGYLFKEGEIFSADGHCRAFDAKAGGTLASSATACVLLKRVADAIADGDQILAVIRGSAINNDGNDKVGYLAPSVSGQTRAISEALAIAGVAADDVGYIECHGTGTRIGDPIELAGLSEALRAQTDRKQFCAIGSLKTNIGHPGETAGAAGLVKTVLALVNREIPPSLHYETPNPLADLPSGPLFVNAKLRPWDAPRRIAGITALGAGGTNAHVLIEEAPAPRPSGPSRTQQLLVLSGRTASALGRVTENLADHLREHPDANLADVAFTLAVGRKPLRHRRTVVAREVREAIEALGSRDAKRTATQESAHRPLAVAFLFPGGGAQYAGMARELYEREPTFRATIDKAIAFVQPRLREDLRSLLFPETQAVEAASARLEAPSLALPALFAIECAIARLLMEWGVEPTAFIGHSAGEYVAAHLAGTLSFEDGLALVATRGRLFETLPEGAMLSIALGEADARARFAGDESLSIAAINAPDLCVVSGPRPAVDRFEARMRDEEIEHQRVHIRVAAHSSMLEPILGEFRAFCRTIKFARPRLPFVSNVTGTWIQDAEATDPEYWVRHLRQSVRFADGVKTLLDKGDHAFIEVGPGRTLGSLARQQPGKASVITSTMRHPKEEGSDLAFLLAALGRAWCGGAEIDPRKLYAGQERRRVPLPTYPFERERYWIEPGQVRGPVAKTSALKKRSDIAEWFYAPAWVRKAVPPLEALARTTWLVLSGGSSIDAPLVARLRNAGDRVVTVSAGRKFERGGDEAYSVDPSRAADFDALVADLRARDALPQRVLHLFALGKGGALRDAVLRRAAGPLATYADDQARAFSSQAFLARALGRESDAFAWITVTDGVQSVGGETPSHPERATALGVSRVLPREMPDVTATAIDVVVPRLAGAEHARLVDRLAREVRGALHDEVVAYRKGDRFVQRFERVRLDASPPSWVRERGTYLITGGLGGIGLAVADHLARTAPSSRLVLVSRGDLPPESGWDDRLSRLAPDDEQARRIRAVRALKRQGAEVLVVRADVSDRGAMSRAIDAAHERFGAITGVFHSAGVLDDRLLAMRDDTPTTPVLDAKVRGALVLDAILGDEPELFVVFSSVSSILGLPGQADYTAGNAFLDAFAHARRSRGARGRTVSIDWNAWAEVGMAVAAARAPRASHVDRGVSGPRATTAPIVALVSDSETEARFDATLDRVHDWLVGEHVVRGGDALVPGTGLLEIAREAIEHPREDRALELREVVFLAPFAVAPSESRTLHAVVKRGTPSELVLFSEREDAPHATAKGGYVDAPPAARVDLAAIGARCTRSSEILDGHADQTFMDFGPRWANLRRIDYGDGEALISLQMPAPYVAELSVLRLHPALLDMATGCAQGLIPGFDRTRTFFVPFSYGRVLVRRELPARLFSHVRLRPTAAKDLAVFDVTLLDEAGDEVATIESFTMRLIPASARFASRRGEEVGPRGAASLEAAIRDGILPHEGVEALDRVLAADVAPQVVATSVDLHAWQADVSEQARASRAVRTATDDGAPTFSRPKLGSDYVEPSTPIQRELAALWREMLGVDGVGARDDFFELGGQSLVAVRLFSRIRKKYGVELPIATLFEAPTIEQCAAVLARARGLADHPDDAGAAASAVALVTPLPSASHVFRHVVRIQSGGARAPLFCVHGAGGNVLNFRDLSRSMAREQPFYGLQASGIDGVERPLDSIEEMAEAYLPELRAVRPHGPYLLAGYSGGGVVAFEMARRLTDAGEAVDLLAFIDTFHPQMPVRRVTMRRRLERLRDERIAYLRSGFAVQVRGYRQRKTAAEIDRLLVQGAPIPSELRDAHLTRSFESAAAAYRPRPWSGRATLLRAEDVEYIYRDAGPTYGWDGVIRGGLEVVRVPGNHYDLLLEPNASILVRSLNATLDAVAARERTSAAGE